MRERSIEHPIGIISNLEGVMTFDPISNLLADSQLVTDRGSSLDWNGLKIERHILKAGAKSSHAIDRHYLMLWEQAPSAAGEIETRQGTFVRYRKLLGTITTLIPGIRPGVRTKEDHAVLVCSLSPRFLHDLELEMDRRPKGPFQALHGTDDGTLRELMYQLVRGAADESGHDTVRTESLFVKLGTRLLFASRLLSQDEPPSNPHFPRHLLRRVLEKMHEELDSNLSLSALAADSGYSRAHFMRIFKAVMGVSPHTHLLELRLQRAQKMLTSAATSKSLIDIALACGFRSHAHFTTAFARRFGLAPSFYRKALSAA
jgi:AraC family transcriptional regulator